MCERAAARVRRVCDEERPALPDFPHVRLVADRADGSLDAAHARFLAHHADLVELLDSLTESERERVGVLETAGPATVAAYVWHVASELTDHLGQLARALHGRP